MSGEFRVKKKQVAIYFNDGKASTAVWNEDYVKALKNEKLIAAINAAREEFFRVFNPTKPPEGEQGI